jgi:predicted Na+-dependent transporter
MQPTPLRDMLAFAGRNGPMMLFVGVLIGLLEPRLAEAARPFLGVAVFVFTLGAFLKVDLPAFRRELESRTWIVGVLAWTTFGVPLTMFGLLRLFEPEPALAQGMMLAMLAPPVGSAAAIAAMLGLGAPLSLLATVIAMLLSPLYLPPLASLLAGQELHIDPITMAKRLLIIVGGACLAASLLRRYAGRFVADNPHAMTGIAVIGLILVAIGAMRGMQDIFFTQPREVVRFLALAFLVNIGFQVLGAALFAAGGRHCALTIGLVSGNRNVTLAWAAAGPSLLAYPQVELYLAMSVFPIFMLPALTRRPVAWMLRASAAIGSAAATGTPVPLSALTTTQIIPVTGEGERQ